MSMDAITIDGLCRQLQQELSDSRVDKIFMPRREEVILSLRSRRGAWKLVISCSGAGGRVYLTGEKTENPDAPPMFCMLLRKHLTAARLLEVSQPEHERMLLFRFSAYDDFGEMSEKSLVVELTGRRNNLILLSGDGTILGCLKKVDSEMSPQRPILPGLRYQMPPRPVRRSLLALTEEEARALAKKALSQEEGAKALTGELDLVSPLIARELWHRGGGREEALAAEIMDLSRRVQEGDYQPTLLRRGEEYVDFSFMPMSHLGEDTQNLPQEGFSQMIEKFYGERASEERRKSVSSALEKLMANQESRLVRKLANQQNDLLRAEKREDLKRRADLIMANIHMIPQGAEKVTVIDYFSPDLPQVELELSGDKTPQQNAQALFKEYTRMKNAQQALEEQIVQGEQELEYVQSVQLALQQARDIKEVNAIREELLESGYLRSKEKHPKKKKPAAFQPREYVSPSGLRILCGRNNRENDQLTLRTAGKNDLWFHSQKAPGSHVILFTQGQTPTGEDLEYAARIAAGHSKLAKQSLAPIDYALARHVKKPAGAKPGMVIYTDYKTLFVRPLDD